MTARTFGLIPAAGLSRRMGRPKLALPLGGKTVLERVVAAVHQAGVVEVLVVVGPQGAELAALAVPAGAQVLQLREETPDMRTTVQHGLDWLEEHLHPVAEDSWLLMPADHPTLKSDSILALTTAKAANPAASILVPTWQGRRGHPALIGWQHVAAIRQLAPGLGLNAILRGNPQVVEVPVADPDILCDLDTPEDYERLLAHG